MVIHSISVFATVVVFIGYLLIIKYPHLADGYLLSLASNTLFILLGVVNKDTSLVLVSVLFAIINGVKVFSLVNHKLSMVNRKSVLTRQKVSR